MQIINRLHQLAQRSTLAIVMATSALAGATSSVALAEESSPATAQVQAPDELIRSVFNEVSHTVLTKKEELKNNPEQLQALIDTKLLPHLDFNYMSQLALSKHWRKASRDQKIRFRDAFKNLLVRTYSNALTDYSGEQLELAPFRGDTAANRVKVKGKVTLTSGKAVPVIFQLRLTKTGWKIFDGSVENVSLITNYRSNFASEIKKAGLEALITRLENDIMNQDKPAQ